MLTGVGSLPSGLARFNGGVLVSVTSKARDLGPFPGYFGGVIRELSGQGVGSAIASVEGSFYVNGGAVGTVGFRFFRA